MRYAKIVNYDTANGPGLRTVLYVQGCYNRCPNCFNESTWDIHGGHLFDDKTKKYLFDLLEKPGIKGLSVLGGEPLIQGEDLYNLLKEVRNKFKDKTIWVWTGFLYETLTEIQLKILSQVDVVVDGPFIQALKDITLTNRGSSNQRIIDVQKTISNNKIIIWKNNLEEI